MYEYQVIESGSSIDAQILNQMAQRGWRPIAVVAPGSRFYCYFERIVSQELEVVEQGIPGMKCPVCGHTVDDADYWSGSKCLRCALAEEQKQGGNP